MANTDAGPQTLIEAHQVRSRWWPGGNASAAAFAKYYQRGADLYSAVAKTDAGHQNEANWWAGEYRRLANEYAAKVSAGPADSSDGSPTGGG